MDESKKQQVLSCADKILEECNGLAKLEKEMFKEPVLDVKEVEKIFKNGLK